MALFVCRVPSAFDFPTLAERIQAASLPPVNVYVLLVHCKTPFVIENFDHILVSVGHQNYRGFCKHREIAVPAVPKMELYIDIRHKQCYNVKANNILSMLRSGSSTQTGNTFFYI